MQGRANEHPESLPSYPSSPFAFTVFGSCDIIHFTVGLLSSGDWRTIVCMLCWSHCQQGCTILLTGSFHLLWNSCFPGEHPLLLSRRNSLLAASISEDRTQGELRVRANEWRCSSPNRRSADIFRPEEIMRAHSSKYSSAI